MRMKVLAILGTYHEGGNLDHLAGEMLDGAREAGADTEKLLIKDYTIAFCRNCWACAEDPDARLGRCVIDDDMAGLLQKVDDCDVLILGSPVNYGSVTAMTKKFLERLSPFLYIKKRIPFLSKIPHKRVSRERGARKGVALITCVAPSPIVFPLGGIRLAVKQLKISLDVTGHSDKSVFIGGGLAFGEVARRRRLRDKAREFGRALVTS